LFARPMAAQQLNSWFAERQPALLVQ
jgi:hypothetical protein